jgi:hypothetical protein
MEMRPISEDAVDGPFIATIVALVYAWTDQPDTAFEQLNLLTKMPGAPLPYGNLKTDPAKLKASRQMVKARGFIFIAQKRIPSPWCQHKHAR